MELTEEQTGILKIGEYEIPANAMVWAMLDEYGDLDWTVWISALQAIPGSEDATRLPQISVEALQIDLNSWTGLEETVVEHVEEDYQSTILVYEYGELNSSKISIGRRNGRNFELGWQGLCDVCYADLGIDIPFDYTGKAILEGIRVCTDDRNEAFGMLGKLLDKDEFMPPEKDSVCEYWLFAPKEN